MKQSVSAHRRFSRPPGDGSRRKIRFSDFGVALLYWSFSHKESRRAAIGLLAGQPPANGEERSCRQHAGSPKIPFLWAERGNVGGTGEKSGCKLADMSVDFNSATAA